MAIYGGPYGSANFTFKKVKFGQKKGGAGGARLIPSMGYDQ